VGIRPGGGLGSTDQPANRAILSFRLSFQM
jgi:hypothetical protein